jgi:hypothetical protein
MYLFNVAFLFAEIERIHINTVRCPWGSSDSNINWRRILKVAHKHMMNFYFTG